MYAKMKKLIFSALLILGTFAVAAAPVKVVERSASKRPSWIGVADKDFVVVSAEAATLDEARDHCMNDIRQSIVNAVAVNISSEEISTDGQTVRNGEVDRYGSYLSNVKSIAGKLPFLTGITLSKGEIYWEKCLVKTEKRYYYVCHVKYPFSESERNKLIAQFKKQDREQYDKYLEIKRNFSTFRQIEYIAEATAQLTTLLEYFFDDLRRSEVSTLRDSYRRCYDRLMLVPLDSNLGEYTYTLELDGRIMYSSKLPRATSELATEIKIIPAGEGLYRVTYNYETVTADDRPTIELRIGLGTRTLKHTIHFDVREEMMSVYPFGCIEIDLTRSPEVLAVEATQAAVPAEKTAVELVEIEPAMPVAETSAEASETTVEAVAAAKEEPVASNGEEVIAPSGEEAVAADEEEPTAPTLKPAAYDAELRMWLRSRYDTPFEVLGVDLYAEGLGCRLQIDTVKTFEGKGEHRVILPVHFVAAPTADRAALATGSLKLRHRKTGAVKELRVALPYRIITHVKE